MSDQEFQEISHCGGKQYIRAATSPDGKTRSYQFGMTSSGAGPAAWFPIYALSPGIPVATFAAQGIGAPVNPPPYPNCIPIFISSDSHGLFGHRCFACNQYWRSSEAPANWLTTCCYCGVQSRAHSFLTESQQAYVEEFCRLFEEALSGEISGEYSIDMDEIAEKVKKGHSRPAFYYAGESQQHMYACEACDSRQDILGLFGYCSCCCTANCNLVFRNQMTARRKEIARGGSNSDHLRNIVSSFDSTAGWYCKQLTKDIPMTKHRKETASKLRFHNIKRDAATFSQIFDIDLLRRVKPEELELAHRLFCRRHVHEHLGGEVDQHYLDQTNDTSVRLKQALREDKEELMKLTGIAERMISVIHGGFHEIFPPQEIPIKMTIERRARMKTSRAQ